jgi:hypothetical protein
VEATNVRLRLADGAERTKVDGSDGRRRGHHRRLPSAYLLPLDDCLYSLQATIPHLARSSLRRRNRQLLVMSPDPKKGGPDARLLQDQLRDIDAQIAALEEAIGNEDSSRDA